MTVESHYEDVYQLILRGQINKNKNKTGNAKFTVLSYPLKMEVVVAG